MGTNFYLMSKNKNLMREYFAVGLFKQVCRKYIYLYPEMIISQIYTYKEMYKFIASLVLAKEIARKLNGRAILMYD